MNRLLPACLLLFTACAGGDAPPARTGTSPSPRTPAFVEQNQEANRIEARDLSNYAARRGLRTHVSGTGVHHVLLRDQPGDTARPGQWVAMNYRMELLNGTLCSASEPGHPESFQVELDHVESGLHEAVQHLSPGDSAVILIPSYRAHGLIGDMDKVPPRSSIVYHIGLVSLTEPRGR
ncbi:MAG: FKBP-type peptidyl-prolyl cis-trans isomerase [Flavobacteriales bacterium]|jgi:FKBP-type peptidyl-prolyl cis-trans isomerase|nr:FKBP-type peptidyl-prolyl cis-trans isomerase [Flavobacteriales bacterium]MBK7941580.1 FKBP-type peptidyl-prolyl cis-trans isomerase [Flavobacteriales bacterium]MBK8949395.1 FKBP-type peptidyl-prolyl cis-trans isomerase [Flavobacteriales bacterium]MBK9700125.1 FKBP-type peptidyl-prolyl cis-trans isomerase [Flavobacteriales bacterium]